MKRRHLIAQAAAIALILTSGTGWGQSLRARTPATAAPAPALNGPLVSTRQGEVQGFFANGVVVYRGLPFAAPPVGELRWRAPQPPATWAAIRPANEFGSSCAQAEDCLYLNVYAPVDAKPGAKLPVMVWIHGGAFIFGSGALYDGTQFAKQNAVIVTVNYRLGRAGWFAHPALTRESPDGLLGNYGLMDQIAALEWVRDNISAFGGDRGNVTIFGESAGAISINYLMLAQQARGLFARAIAESGFGRLPAMPLHADDGSRSVEQIGSAFAHKHGIEGSDASAARALRALSWEQLTKNIGGIGSADQTLPMADGRLITGSAYEGFAKGAEAPVPYLVGGNSDEASLTRRNVDASKRLAAITKRRAEFLAAFDPAKTNDADRIIARLITDTSISEPDRALARLHSQHGHATYVYHFSYIPVAERATSFGLRHGGEIAYVFNTPRRNVLFDEEGKAIAVAANNYWAAFARAGAPGRAGGPAWPKFDRKDEAVMEFGAGGVPVVRKHFHAARLDWVEEERRLAVGG